jgi:acetyl/propionyl-CoA carboxylase alpha subunit
MPPADEAYGLDGDKPADTYLNIAKLIAIAKRAPMPCIPAMAFCPRAKPLRRPCWMRV